MSERKYRYKIQGVENTAALIARLKKRKGVADCHTEGEYLCYTLNENADKNEIILEVGELCAKYGGAIITDGASKESYSQGEESKNTSDNYFGENDGSENNKDDEAENADNEALLEENALSEEDNAASAKNNAASAEDDYDYNDKLVVKRESVKKETIIRAVELAVSAILLVICFFLPKSDTLGGNFVGIFAFAIGGYEIFYSAITDFAHKKFLTENIIMSLACIFGAFLGYIVEITALALVFSVAKEIEVYADSVAQGKLDEIFYTGSVAVETEGGETKKLADISVNDALLLKELDIIPCDGVAKSDCLLDCYRSVGVPEVKVNAGDKVYAGSVVLGGVLKMTAETTNKDSRLNKNKVLFEEKLKKFTAGNKKIIYADLALVIISLLLSFIPPAFGMQGYLNDLRIWGARGIALLSVSAVTYTFYLAAECIKNAIIVMKYNEIEVNDIDAFYKLANANSFTFLSSALTENGKVNADTYGVMNELLAAGVKNVEVKFDNDLADEERAKLEFVQKPVKNKKEITVGEDVTLASSGNIAIERGEISFVPLAFKIAKKAEKRRKIVAIFSEVSFAAVILATALVPFGAINPVFFGIINCAITSLSALLTLFSANS